MDNGEWTIVVSPAAMIGMFWVRSAGTIPSDTKSLAITARARNEEDTGSIPAGGILSRRRESMQRVAGKLP